MLLLQELKRKLSTRSHAQHPLFAAAKIRHWRGALGWRCVSIGRALRCAQGWGRSCAGAAPWGGHGLRGGWDVLWCHIASPLFLVLSLLLHGPICLSLAFYFQFLVTVSQSWPSTRWAAAADVFLSPCGAGGARGGAGAHGAAAAKGSQDCGVQSCVWGTSCSRAAWHSQERHPCVTLSCF